MFINGHLNFDQILQCDAVVQNALIDTNNCNQLMLNQITLSFTKMYIEE